LVSFIAASNDGLSHRCHASLNKHFGGISAIKFSAILKRCFCGSTPSAIHLKLKPVSIANLIAMPHRSGVRPHSIFANRSLEIPNAWANEDCDHFIDFRMGFTRAQISRSRSITLPCGFAT
jgi:hypothetical protein